MVYWGPNHPWLCDQSVTMPIVPVCVTDYPRSAPNVLVPKNH